MPKIPRIPSGLRKLALVQSGLSVMALMGPLPTLVSWTVEEERREAVRTLRPNGLRLNNYRLFHIKVRDRNGRMIRVLVRRRLYISEGWRA